MKAFAFLALLAAALSQVSKQVPDSESFVGLAAYSTD